MVDPQDGQDGSASEPHHDHPEDSGIAPDRKGGDAEPPDGKPEDPKSYQASFVIVGMGASAGGLEAFSDFLRSMPANSGMAFVLVQHLDPHHESIMPELLAKGTAMSVQQVQDEMPVEPDHVYVIPPNAVLRIEAGVLRIEKPAEPRGHRMVIDSFFASLAEDQGPHAICIVLSGTGSDGTLGLRAVKEHGGMAMAQSAETARYDSMPRNAIATRLVDYVLPVDEMPAKLAEYVHHLAVQRSKGPDAIREEAEDHLGQICQMLQRRTGHDFRAYKRGTVVRRIQRRMQVMQIDSVADYAGRLRHDAKEAEELFHDLLIGVTQFFRDPDAFDALAEQVVPKLFEERGRDESIRVWVPGCASGEEAYSIAILLCEHARKLDRVQRVQVFATDIDERALEVARTARYSEAIADHISVPRLERFFSRLDTGFVVCKEIREMCIFSPHDLIKDPPFSSLDLITCRNLLIYLEADLQQRVLPLFHYSLRPQRYLFLGPSEHIAGQAPLFRVVDKKHRIYQAKEAVVRPLIDFPLTEPQRPARLARGPQPPQVSREQAAVRALERALLETYSPPSVIINEQGDAVYYTGRCSKYLEVNPGTPTINVINMARKGLRLDLRTAIYQAIKTREPIAHENVKLQIDDHVEHIRLIVRPLNELGEDPGLYIVVFQEVVSPPRDDATPSAVQSEEPLVQQLEDELRQTKEHLQATIEELETSNEELKSSNEELLSMNEELQSSNEELQTSKEELQSVNEELGTVNAELNKKVEELDRSNSDLQNLLQSTQIATIFLGQDLTIKRFTPAATRIFRMLEGDVGRPITDLAARFNGFDLASEVREVLQSLATRERQVHLPEPDRWYILRILPYRTVNNVIAGVVLTFVDITELQEAQELRARLAAIVEGSQDAVIGETLEGIISSWNAGAERMYGYTAEEAVGKSLSLVVPEDRLGELAPLYEQLRRGEPASRLETVRRRKDGRLLHISLTLSPVRDQDQKLAGISAIGHDLTARVEAEAALAESQQRLSAIIQSAMDAIITVDENQRIVLFNPAAGEMFRCTSAEVIGNPVDRFIPERFREAHREHIRRFSESGQTARAMGHLGAISGLRSDGEEFPLEASISQVQRAGRRLFTVILRDRTERQRIEQEVQQARAAAEKANQAKDHFIAVLSHELRTPLTPVLAAIQEARESREHPEELREILDMVHRNIELEARLIDDLLDMNGLSHGTLKLQLQPSDLKTTLAEVIEICRSESQKRNLDVRLEGTAEDCWVRGDHTRLRQIFWNLLHNAIKFSRDGGTITLRARRDGQHAVAEVQDDGTGIAAEVMPHIFDAFERGEPLVSRRTAGLGLGLSITKTLVELHGGSVEAFSDGRGKGAMFRVNLPVTSRPAAEPSHAERRTSAENDLTTGRAQRLRVLFVEDHVDTRKVMTKLLNRAGHTVTGAGSVQEALAAIEQGPCDLLISDLGLPDGTGYDLIRQVRSVGYTMPAIAMSGFGMDGDVRRSLEAGFSAHLTKPGDINVLIAEVARIAGVSA